LGVVPDPRVYAVPHCPPPLLAAGFLFPPAGRDAATAPAALTVQAEHRGALPVVAGRHQERGLADELGFDHFRKRIRHA